MLIDDTNIMKVFKPKCDFVKFRGTDLYDKEQGSDLPIETSFYTDVKRGNFRLLTVKKFISSEKIIFPANSRVYYSKDFIEVGKEGSFKDLDPELDIKIICNNGFLEFVSDFKYSYKILTNIFQKYHTSKSTWHYKIVTLIKDGQRGNPKPVVTVPTNPEDWSEIIKVFTEFAVCLRLFVGDYYKIIIINSPYTAPHQKFFSTILSFIPTLVNLGYKYVGYPKIMGVLSKNINELSKKEIRPGIRDSLISYAKRNYKDLYLVNLYTGSCYLNPRNIDENSIESLRKLGNPKRLRTMIDWIIKAYDEKKHLIFYSDLDNSVAIAHEIGHYLEDKDGTLGIIQRNSKTGLLSDNFIKGVSFISGLMGGCSGKGMTTEIITSLIAMLSNTPLLFSEYMASYKGYQLLKELGCTQKELDIAKEYYKIAYKSYLAGVPNAGAAASFGRLGGTFLMKGGLVK